jgi:hypothetical protein
MDANTYLSGGKSNQRMCIPAYERIKQLYAFGYTNSQIAESLQSEFHDIEYNPMTVNNIKNIISENMSEFEAAKYELGIKCREEILQQTAMLFRATENVECEMVAIFVRKMRQALNQLKDLDLDETDDMGNYKNTARTFVLIEMVEKFQKSIAKIVGTDALREIEIFRKKADTKFNKENNLIPAFNRKDNQTLDIEPVTNFV